MSVSSKNVKSDDNMEDEKNDEKSDVTKYQNDEIINVNLSSIS